MEEDKNTVICPSCQGKSAFNSKECNVCNKRGLIDINLPLRNTGSGRGRGRGDRRNSRGSGRGGSNLTLENSNNKPYWGNGKDIDLNWGNVPDTSGW